MYTLFSPYDSFFQHVNRPVPNHSDSFVTFPVMPVNGIDQYRNASSFKQPQRKKKELFLTLETEMTGKGQKLDEYI